MTDPDAWIGAYDWAEPAEHKEVCWAAAIGRASRGGRSHPIDWQVIIEDALADLATHPESCTCRRRNSRNTRARS